MKKLECPFCNHSFTKYYLQTHITNWCKGISFGQIGSKIRIKEDILNMESNKLN